MADRENGLAGTSKVPNNLHHARIMAQEFRGPAAEQQHGGVLVHRYVVESDVRIETVALAFDVGVPSGLEIVHDQVEPAGSRSRDHGLEFRFLETMQRIQRLVALAGVSGHKQDSLRHR